MVNFKLDLLTSPHPEINLSDLWVGSWMGCIGSHRTFEADELHITLSTKYDT
jgi:hypothetical protein